jgi:hypothetical protein
MKTPRRADHSSQSSLDHPDVASALGDGLQDASVCGVRIGILAGMLHNVGQECAAMLNSSGHLRDEFVSKGASLGRLTEVSGRTSIVPDSIKEFPQGGIPALEDGCDVSGGWIGAVKRSDLTEC